MKDASSISELRAALNKHNSPDFEAQAEKGFGVMETLNTLSRIIIAHLKSGNL